MTIDENGISFIRGFEGFSASAYNDIADRLTIGIGHLIKPSEDFSSGITLSQAKTLLYTDLEPIEETILKLAPGCSQNQFNALCSFGFNLGVGSLEQMLSHGIAQVPIQILRWNKAKVNGELVPVAGLTRRRQAESELFSAPESA